MQIYYLSALLHTAVQAHGCDGPANKGIALRLEISPLGTFEAGTALWLAQNERANPSEAWAVCVGE